MGMTEHWSSLGTERQGSYNILQNRLSLCLGCRSYLKLLNQRANYLSLRLFVGNAKSFQMFQVFFWNANG